LSFEKEKNSEHKISFDSNNRSAFEVYRSFDSFNRKGRPFADLLQSKSNERQEPNKPEEKDASGNMKPNMQMPILSL